MLEALYWGRPQCALGDQEKWPSQGSLNYNTTLQLDLFYKSKSKLRSPIQISLIFLSLEKQWVLAQATQVGNDYMAQAVECRLQA
jgi:hypothetical protein